MNAINKKRSGLRIMAELLKLLGKLKYIIILAVIGGYLGNACAIAVMTLGACCVSKLIDPAFLPISLGILIALTIGAGILRGLLRFLEQYHNHFIAFKLLAVLRDRIFGALRKLAPAKLEGAQKGNLIAMLTADVETLEVFYAHTISPVMIAILVEGTAVVLISVIGAPLLGLIAICVYLLIGVVIPFTSNAMLRSEGAAYRNQFADSSSYFLDSVCGVFDIVQNRQQEKRRRELNSQSAALNQSTVSIKRKSAAVGAFSNLAVSAAILLSLYAGMQSVLAGNLKLTHMIVSLVLLFSSFGPVLSLASLPSNLTQTFASGDRILDFMAETPAVEENKGGAVFDFDSLSVENLSFSYEAAPTLQNISLEIKKGKIIGLAGPSGCGKSTLLKLMLRFYDPKSGRVRYNGMDLREINTASLHKNVTMVSQDTWLFDDTVYGNLIFAKPDATRSEVREACRKAAIDDFITALPNGYDTEVGLLGDSLSTGERQRIGLARAFLSGAPLILLDEVTSNVDAISEGIILKSLKDVAGEKTIVIVSHRESTVSICDEIYLMSDGRLRKH